jgi:cytidine deaminase
MIDRDALIAAATRARENAHAPFSKFKVGAALHCVSGRIVTGCNVESASYSLTLCAERVAVFNAVSQAERVFDAIAIVTDATTVTPPCGACRQILWEFCGDAEVILANVAGAVEVHRLSALLPKPFDASAF